VIEGELGPRCASAFDGTTFRADDGETEITDDTYLHGLFERIAGLALRLHRRTLLDETPTPVREWDAVEPDFGTSLATQRDGYRASTRPGVNRTLTLRDLTVPRAKDNRLGGLQ